MSLTNYHTHTLFCDGKNTPEEIVNRAISLGMDEIGFSAHSDLCPDIDSYRRAVSELKEKYRGRISVKLGIEYDYFSEVDISEYDYVIGGVHYLELQGKRFSLDHTKELFLPLADKYYGGDIYSLCEHYYETVAKVYDKTGCDIVAHFDLVTKYNEGDKLFDTTHPRYIKAATAALEMLVKKPVIFEINTGAIARGHRTSAYPSKNLLDIILKNGRDTILSSDCHDMDNLTESFDKYRHLATLDKLPSKK